MTRKVTTRERILALESVIRDLQNRQATFKANGRNYDVLRVQDEIRRLEMRIQGYRKGKL